jgi:TonB family protein
VVRDALIAKSSGSNVGFDEAAIKAALQRRYRPALQNGRPVAVWVTYKIVFRLE